jgi:hypothetical protein
LLYMGKKLVNIIPDVPLMTFITYCAMANKAPYSRPSK